MRGAPTRTPPDQREGLPPPVNAATPVVVATSATAATLHAAWSKPDTGGRPSPIATAVGVVCQREAALSAAVPGRNATRSL